VLSDFALFDLFSEGGTVAGTVTTCATYFLCSFCHCVGEMEDLVMVLESLDLW
jgi:hypothetical protein